MEGNRIIGAALMLAGALVAAPHARGQEETGQAPPAPRMAAEARGLLAVQAVRVSGCGPRARLVARLQERFGEWRRMVALAPGGRAIYELFAADQGRSWTILVTLPDGRSCLIAAGEGYEAITLPEPAPGAPA